LSVVYFTDRDLGLKFPETLRASGLDVELHRDHFVGNHEVYSATPSELARNPHAAGRVELWYPSPEGLGKSRKAPRGAL